MSEEYHKFGLRLNHSDGKGVGGKQIMHPEWTLYYLCGSEPKRFSVHQRFSEEDLADPKRFAYRLRDMANAVDSAAKQTQPK